MVTPLELPPPNPDKLLAAWMEWEAGELSPGSLCKELKVNGLRQVLEELANRSQP